MRILSNVNVAGMRRFAEARFPGEHIDFAPYGQVAQELLDPSSPLNTDPPKYALIYLEGFALFPEYSGETHGFQDAVDLAEARLSELLQPVTAYLARNPDTCMVVNTITYPPWNGHSSLDRNLVFGAAMTDAFNLGLSRWRSEQGLDRLIICDWAAVAARLGSETLYDERLWYLGRMPLSPRGQEELANLYARSVRALSGAEKKALVVDLDNTLWGGVIGENDVEGIELGEDGLGKVYRDLQGQIRQLKDRGVLLAISSKNNRDDVDRVFSEHPMMVLSDDDFVARKIGWDPKPLAITELSEDLSLGLDSFVFVDDSPVERDLMKQRLPGVSTPDFPDDPFTINSWFGSITAEYFDTLQLTEEDEQRTEMYRTDARRREDSRRFCNLEDFLRSLDMEMRVWIDHREQVQRIAQLTQKTNQFNLTTRRYEVSDIEAFIASPDARVYDVELRDRYGSSGIVGVVIVKIGGEEAETDTFLLSCRVIGRNLEQALFAFVVDDLATAGVKTVTAEYVAAPRNVPAKDLLDRLGFDGSGKIRQLKVRQINSPDYIRVIRSEK